ncbi:hypothetical protein N7495_005325 [Penicillium taxi]|uniref:uncharacterized protein n=1 Tax=Penicillium taxi TaxID=168475 RepID=UPI002545621A|nr:uncharacterized protein N7495_005325 [Penicillium taxi]KAJ5893634.1 hypothetical protein N7495_005325 [Penicillium taxi]
MSHTTHGGRIVPILTGHQQQIHDSTIQLKQHHSLPRTIDSPQLQRSSNSMPAKSVNCEDIPCLRERDLFALPTEGDGNCLYYSLSDQLYGDFNHGDTIRQRLADHIASNRNYFMQFVVAQGGERRRPKRAAASTYATRSADVSAPTEADKERRFNDMVALTRKNGEWGSSEHLQAFCQSYQVDINVYTSTGIQTFRDVNASPDDHKHVVHVAFHDFKHYSSVRALYACHNGLLTTFQQPTSFSKDVIGKEVEDTSPGQDSDYPSSISSSASSPAHTSTSFSTNDTSLESFSTNNDNLAIEVFPPWDIQSIQDGLGGRYDRKTIINMLQKCRGDIDRAFAALLDDKNDSSEKKLAHHSNLKPSLQISRSSSPYSTGSKRSADDSDDDSEDPQATSRRGRPMKRPITNLTMGVGISFRDDQNEVVSLKLRMKADAEKARSDVTPSDSGIEQHDFMKGPRRSSRFSQSRRA